MKHDKSTTGVVLPPSCSASYLSDWKQIATRIKDAAGWICERCKHPHDMSSGHVLTVHHLDGNKANCDDWNLAALCQRCHLTVQGRTVMHQLFMPEILDVSEWFKPHLEGYLRSLTPNAEVSGPPPVTPESKQSASGGFAAPTG